MSNYKLCARPGPPTRAALGGLALGLWLALSGVSAAGADAGSPAVDLNRASAEQLEELPGVGAAKAEAIVAHRKANGRFATFDDLEAVRGIGPALVERLRPLVTLGKPARAAGKSAGSRSGSGPKR